MDKNTYTQVKNILFLDIETITLFSSYEEMDERGKKLWDKKSLYFEKFNLGIEQTYRQKGGIFAEFSKIIAISVGFFILDENDKLIFRVKTFSSLDEKEVLSNFKQLIEDKFNPSSLRLCAHNGKEFDYPYLCKRFLINQIRIPSVLDISGKKPWEIMHLDTMDMWKFGDFKNQTSLETLAYVFNVPSSKDDIDGSQVSNTFYDEENGLEKITNYCQNDVIVLAQIYLSFQCLPQLTENQIIKL